MPIIDYNGKPLELNEEVFMMHPEEWNHDIALFLAQKKRRAGNSQ